MGDTASSWPGEDPAAISLATRVVLLTAATATCNLGSYSPDQRELLALVQMATDMRLVRGRPFSEFLEAAKRQLARDVASHGLEDAAKTLADIERCKPADPIGDLYDRLVDLASDAYAESLSEALNPTLHRTVLGTEPHLREVPVRGGVRKYANEVELLIHLPRFDLAGLTLVPRILAHELICHIAARHTGNWVDTPVPDVRTFFSEGFMDRAAWRLFMTWLDAGELPTTLPLEQLSGTELEDSADRPMVFRAGRRAFDNCLAKTTEHMRRHLAGGPTMAAQLRAVSEDASIRAALRMNTCPSHIMNKDWFVHFARGDERAKAASFGFVAAEDVDPTPLLDDEENGAASD
jgi:hypothetical protein